MDTNIFDVFDLVCKKKELLPTNTIGFSVKNFWENQYNEEIVDLIITLENGSVVESVYNLNIMEEVQ